MRSLILGDDIPLDDLPDLSGPSTSAAHQTIERWLVRQISEERFSVGDRLPSEGALAQALGVSRMTLRQSLATLESRGVLERRRGGGGGTFIVEPKLDCDLTGMAGFTEQMRRANMRAGARVVSARTVPARRTIMEQLSLARGATVYEIVRVRSANRKPVALERAYLPVTIFPDLITHQLTGSLYSLMRRCYGNAPSSSHESLGAVASAEEEADLLGVEVGSPLILIERTGYTVAGLPVEYARDLYRPDRARIKLWTGVTSEAQENSAPDPQISVKVPK